MPNIINKFHAYNKVFFLNLNKFGILSTLFNLIFVGLIAFPNLRWLQDRTVLTELPIIHYLINLLSGGFMSFAKTNVSSSNDSLDRSMCMILTKAFDCFAFFSSYL